MTLSHRRRARVKRWRRRRTWRPALKARAAASTARAGRDLAASDSCRAGPAAQSWRDRVAADVGTLALRYADDAFDDEVYDAVAAAAGRAAETSRARTTLQRDPYGELGPLGAALARRCAVESRQCLLAKNEQRVDTSLAVGGRRLRVVYEASGGTMRYAATLISRDAARPPKALLRFACFSQKPRWPKIRLAGWRALSAATGIPLDPHALTFYLLSLTRTYDNAYDLDEAARGPRRKRSASRRRRGRDVDVPRTRRGDAAAAT